MSALTSSTYRVVPGAISHRLLCYCATDAAAAANRVRGQRGCGVHPQLHRVATRGSQSSDNAKQVDYRYAEERQAQSERREPAVYLAANSWIGFDDAEYIGLRWSGNDVIAVHDIPWPMASHGVFRIVSCTFTFHIGLESGHSWSITIARSSTQPWVALRILGHIEVQGLWSTSGIAHASYAR
jgi:hypothetical protein